MKNSLYSINTSSAGKTSVSELGSLTVHKSKKCLRAKTFAIRDDGPCKEM